MADTKLVIEKFLQNLDAFGYFLSKYNALKEVEKDIIRKTMNTWKKNRFPVRINTGNRSCPMYL
ncbi:hypothetical protein KY284_034091 [Solanum tuberosum]|nr:hypothetical protein KY284_034091 [Solanum tuberosum]